MTNTKLLSIIPESLREDLIEEVQELLSNRIGEDPEEKKPDHKSATKQAPATGTELDKVFEYLNF